MWRTAAPEELPPGIRALNDALWNIVSENGQGAPAKKSSALSYSGGMDSRFLAHAGQLLGYEVHLFMAVGPHVPPDEITAGQKWAKLRHMDIHCVEVDPLRLPLVVSNDRQRCYACKREMLSQIKKALRSVLNFPLPLCDGSNASDARKFRPGARAVREQGVLSPLALAGLEKADIYHLARASAMERPDQKPRPCMLTRLPYGVRAERKILTDLAAAEQVVHNTLEKNALHEGDFRLRLIPDSNGGLVPQLHMLQDDMKLLPSAVRLQLSTVTAEILGVSAIHIVPVETLSGYFDASDDQPYRGEDRQIWKVREAK